MEAFGNSASKTITYKIIRFLVSFRKRLSIFVDLLTNWNAIDTDYEFRVDAYGKNGTQYTRVKYNKTRQEILIEKVSMRINRFKN